MISAVDSPLMVLLETVNKQDSLYFSQKRANLCDPSVVYRSLYGNRHNKQSKFQKFYRPNHT